MSVSNSQILRDSFVEFMNRILPSLGEPYHTVIMNQWHPLKELLLDSSRNPLDAFLYVTRLPQAYKETQSQYTVSEQRHSAPNIQEPLKFIAQSGASPDQAMRIKSDTDEIRLTEKTSMESKESKESPLHQRSQQLKIETKNVFVKQLSKRKVSGQAFGNIGKKDKIKEQQEHMISKIKSDEIQQQGVKPMKLERVVQHRASRWDIFGISNLIAEGVKQFRKDGQTLQAVYEKSSEIDTPMSPPKQQIVFGQIQPQYMAPITTLMPQPFQPSYTLKGYSIYAKRGFIQPMQMENHFAAVQQQYRNQIVKKVFM